MSDSIHLSTDDRSAGIDTITNPSPSNLISQGSPAGQPQFLTISYNPAAHPKQVSLIDVNGQPIQYTLVPSNQPISTQTVPHVQLTNNLNTPNATNILPSANGCCIGGSHAVAKCTYGISRGAACGRLLCLSHIMELPGANGGRYPHCPEHYQYIQQHKCILM